jgi:purine-binding chemotaxis protein CheW
MIGDKDIFDDYFYVDDDDDEDTQKDKYLTFRVKGEEYGVDIKYVVEVIGILKITSVPDMPGFIKGVVNLRGKVIPVVDVRTRFNIEFKEYDDRTCVIVVNINDTDIGLVVDIVSDVLDIPEEVVVPPPNIQKSHSSRFIKGIGKLDEKVVIILDVNKLLYDEELEQLSGD